MTSFTGFSEDDFGHLRGSCWRGRNAFGGLLASTLHYQTGLPYRSWGVTRRLELHIASDNAYQFTEAQRFAKMFVYTHSDLAVGFYVEPRTQINENKPFHQHWHTFQQGIQHNPAMCTALLCAMANHNLKLTDYYQKDNAGGILNGVYAFNDGRLQFWNPDQEVWTDTHVNYLIQQIAEIQTEHPAHLHLFYQIDQLKAIEMGKDIVEPVLKILRGVLPLYEMTIA
jgi:hypothetical protein